MNRISRYLTDDQHPFDRPEFADRQRALQVLCLGIIVSTALIVFAITLVVRYALGGRPILQNGAMVNGIPIVTVVGAVLTLSAVAIAVLVVPRVWSAGWKRIATQPPPSPEPGTAPDTEADRLWKLYGQGKFIEYGLGDGAAILTAILYHLSADWLMLVFVAGMLGFLIVRFPTRTRMRAWFDDALIRLGSQSP
jgi:hypothetical protein